MGLVTGSVADGVRHRTSARARRLTLRVTHEGGAVCTRPRRTPLAEAEAFVRAQSDWLERRLAALPPRVVVAPGAVLSVEGAPLAVTAGEGPARREGGRLVLPAAAAGPAAATWLRGLAAARLEAACARHSGALGLRHGRLRLRDPRTRWGSCSPSGDLMFSWRLAMAPPEVLGYVAAHEVAHLAHMDHSPAFWAVVARLDPGWRGSRDWLRLEGSALMRVAFG